MKDLNRISFKGASIYDLILTIETIASADGGAIQSLIETWMEKHSNPKFVNQIIGYKFERLAYHKVLDFIREEFAFGESDMEVFKQKTFRGNKILAVIDYLDFEIKHCTSGKEQFDTVGLGILDSLSKPIFVSQESVFSQIKSLIHEGFLEHSRNRRGFMEIWVNQNFVDNNPNGEIQKKPTPII